MTPAEFCCRCPRESFLSTSAIDSIGEVLIAPDFNAGDRDKAAKSTVEREGSTPETTVDHTDSTAT